VQRAHLLWLNEAPLGQASNEGGPLLRRHCVQGGRLEHVRVRRACQFGFEGLWNQLGVRCLEMVNAAPGMQVNFLDAAQICLKHMTDIEGCIVDTDCNQECAGLVARTLLVASDSLAPRECAALSCLQQ
jgi:hypothetical protein